MFDNITLNFSHGLQLINELSQPQLAYKIAQKIRVYHICYGEHHGGI